MKKRSLVSAAAAVAALGLAASSVEASTTITYGGYADAVPTGQTTLTNFSTAAGLSGTYSLLTGSTGDGAAPYMGASGADQGQYLSILGSMPPQTYGTYTLASATSLLSLYIGSLDQYNTVVFNLVGGGSQTFTGGELGVVSGAAASGDWGNQSAADTNGRFYFNFGSAKVSSISFTSSENSFEIADVTSGVPEPGTWALMIAGAAMMGAGLRFARRQGTATQLV